MDQVSCKLDLLKDIFKKYGYSEDYFIKYFEKVLDTMKETISSIEKKPSI